MPHKCVPCGNEFRESLWNISVCLFAAAVVPNVCESIGVCHVGRSDRKHCGNKDHFFGRLVNLRDHEYLLLSPFHSETIRGNENSVGNSATDTLILHCLDFTESHFLAAFKSFYCSDDTSNGLLLLLSMSLRSLSLESRQRVRSPQKKFRGRFR